MSGRRVYLFRFFAFLLTVTGSVGVLAQPTDSFEALDVDASGSLSRREFAEPPGLRPSAELFADLDANRDGTVSRGEWEAASPNGAGMPQGSRWVGVGSVLATPRAQSFHGASVPKDPEADRAMRSLSPGNLDDLKSGHAGASGTKRGLTAVPQSPPPALPPVSPPVGQ